MFRKTCSEVTWVCRVPWGFLVFIREIISFFRMLMRHYENFRSPCCFQIPSRPVSCIGGWVQLIAEKETLIVVASLVIHHCAIKIEKYPLLFLSNSRTSGFEWTATVWFCCVDFKVYVSFWHHALVLKHAACSFNPLFLLCTPFFVEINEQSRK